jgi:serine/threonine protein kinase
MVNMDQDDVAWFKPGDRLGDYEVVKVLDRGTFSYNLEVRDLAVRPFLGVVHHREDLRPEVTLAGVRLEASLKHQGLPKIEHVGGPCEQSRGHVWFIREYLDPPWAQQVRTTGQPLPANDVLQIGRGVCELLEYLHDPNQHSGGPVVHGFLLPGYVHPAGERRVKVTGLDVQALVRAGIPVPLRHLRNRCPECLDCSPDELTPANDLWALAGCLLFIATGRPAVSSDRDSVESIRRAHEERVPQQRAGDASDRRLRDLLLQAFAEDPAVRFRTARDFRQAIERAATSGALVRVGAPGDEGHEAFSSQTVIAQYPAPIATAYRRLFQPEDSSTRLRMVFAAVEATLRYLVTLGVGDLFRSLASSGEDASQLLEHEAFAFLRRHQPMTLGGWRSALAETARVLAERANGIVRELPSTCRPDGTLLPIIDRLIQARNKCSHEDGSIAITSEECREVTRSSRPMLDEILQQVQFVRNYPLGFVRRSVGSSGSPDRHRYYAHSCMGSRVSNTEEAFVVEVPIQLHEELPFVVTPDESRLLYLWPLLRQRVSSQSQRHSLYVFEEIPNGRSFLTEIRSAAIDIREPWRESLHDKPSGSLGWLMQRLRTLPAAVDLPPESCLAEKLLPSRGGRLANRMLGSNRLLAPVATGGFGTIYSAESASGQRLAVKVIESPEGRHHFPRLRQEFLKLREAAGHVGIVRCFEWGSEVIDHREYPWYSMEFALGGDLAGRIMERRSEAGELPWNDPVLRPQITAEFTAVVEAVAYLHQLGIVHRDIKPSNVLIMENGGLRLSDFGLVKNLNPSEETVAEMPRTSTGAVFGTRHYMAPEQERAEGVDERADVYSLGILLAELATGSRPEADAHVAKDSTLHRWRPLTDLPKAMARFVRRCTDCDRSKRPSDAKALGAEFARIGAAMRWPAR